MTGEAHSATSSELVWDTASRGTAFLAAESSISIAGPHGWSPEIILATSVAASIMTRFLALAASANLEVLGYVSRQHATPVDESHIGPIELSACIVTSTDEGAAHAQSLFDTAVTDATVVRALRTPPTAEVRITVLRDRRYPVGIPTKEV